MTAGLFTAFGVIGSSLCIGVYFALARGKLRADSPWYYSLNGIGAALILIGVLHRFDGGDLGAALQEICWIAVSFVGLLTAIKKPRA